MDIKDLRYFVAVYQAKSVNQAAKKLYITPQGLSRIIKNLEDSLEAPLFVRTQRGVFPTEAADFLYDRVQLVLEPLAEIEAGVRQLVQREKKLRVACSNGVLNALSADIILDFIKMHPDIQVEWSEHTNTTVKEMVSAFEADIGLAVGDGGDEAVKTTPLSHRKVMLLVHQGHPFYHQASVSISALKGERVVILNRAYQINAEFKQRCLEEGFLPSIAAETADSHLLYKLCRSEMGLGVLMDFSMDYFQLDGMRLIPFAEEFTWDIYEHVHAQCLEFPLVQIFQTHVRDFLREGQ